MWCNDSLDGIIKSISFYGFPMTISDLIDFVPDDSLKNDSHTVWSRLERRELPNLAELRQETESLDTLVAGITEENRHDEIDFGPPVGEEIW
jgi:antitoxin component of MazEF toxin-antitoxin module